MYTLENQAFEDVSPIRKGDVPLPYLFFGWCISLQSTQPILWTRIFFLPWAITAGFNQLLSCCYLQKVAAQLIQSEQRPFEGNRRVSIKFNNCQLQASHLRILINLLGSTCDRQTSNRATKSVLPLSAWNSKGWNSGRQWEQLSLMVGRVSYFQMSLSRFKVAVPDGCSPTSRRWDVCSDTEPKATLKLELHLHSPLLQ